MAKNTDIIKQEIEQFRQDNGGDYPEYYIGITNNPDRRIVEDIEDEVLNEHIRAGIYDGDSPKYVEEAESREAAVEIEQHFQTLGMKKYNPRSKGVETTRYVYCFKIAEDSELLTEKEEKEESELTANSEEGRKMHRHIKSFEEFGE